MKKLLIVLLFSMPLFCFSQTSAQLEMLQELLRKQNSCIEGLDWTTPRNFISIEFQEEKVDTIKIIMQVSDTSTILQYDAVSTKLVELCNPFVFYKEGYKLRKYDKYFYQESYLDIDKSPLDKKWFVWPNSVTELK